MKFPGLVVVAMFVICFGDVEAQNGAVDIEIIKKDLADQEMHETPN